MSEPIYDASGKWLVEIQGKVLARIGGLKNVVSCKAVQPEVVTSRQLPDGLLEVRLAGDPEPALLLVEFCTYPESRVPQQLYDDVQMVRQARGVLPDVLALVLCRKGKMEVPEGCVERSKLGFTRSDVGWKVVTLWSLDAEEMLATPDVGIVPLVPLMKFDGPPEPLLRRCRERIDKEGGAERGSLLAVSHLLAGVRFYEKPLLDLFLRSESMIESPVAREIHDIGWLKGKRDSLEFVLKRLGKLTDDAKARLLGIGSGDRLDQLLGFAITCPTMEAFVERLNQETTPPPKPTSSRRKRKE